MDLMDAVNNSALCLSPVTLEERLTSNLEEMDVPGFPQEVGH